jgi:hypothetical protein
VRNGSVDYVQVPALLALVTGYGEQTISKNRRQDITNGDLAQLARASDLHSEGQRFDSVILHQEVSQYAFQSD